MGSAQEYIYCLLQGNDEQVGNQGKSYTEKVTWHQAPLTHHLQEHFMTYPKTLRINTYFFMNFLLPLLK